MKRIVLAMILVLPGLAQAQRAVGNVDPAALDDARRVQAMQQQQDMQSRIQRARDKCLANRGTDCDTMDGLQEWLLLDRTRADAVLDRIYPVPSASAGGSAVPGSTVPDLSPRNTSAVPR